MVINSDISTRSNISTQATGGARGPAGLSEASARNALTNATKPFAQSDIKNAFADVFGLAGAQKYVDFFA